MEIWEEAETSQTQGFAAWRVRYLFLGVWHCSIVPGANANFKFTVTTHLLRRSIGSYKQRDVPLGGFIWPFPQNYTQPAFLRQRLAYRPLLSQRPWLGGSGR